MAALGSMALQKAVIGRLVRCALSTRRKLCQQALRALARLRRSAGFELLFQPR